MKNEVMARAITQIDDDLIEQAFAAKKIPFRAPLWAVAACLALVCSLGLGMLFMGSPTARIDGKSIPQQGMVLERPTPLTIDARSIGDITVEMEVSPGAVWAKEGLLEVYAAESGALLHSGRFYRGTQNMLLRWTVPNPDPAKSYALRLGSVKTLRLLFDLESNQWKIISQ